MNPSKCYFCEHKLEISETDSFYIYYVHYHDNVKVSYIFYDDLVFNTYKYEFPFESKIFGMSFFTNRDDPYFHFYKVISETEVKSILVLDYIPTFTPEEAIPAAKRLLHLKAFI